MWASTSIGRKKHPAKSRLVDFFHARSLFILATHRACRTGFRENANRNPSEAIAYLPDRAWEQGIEQLDCSGGRKTLTEMLESLDCMKRPFLEIYWRSEAF
jgi:hypothetical protein